MRSRLQYSTVQYSTMQHSTIQYSTKPKEDWPISTTSSRAIGGGASADRPSTLMAKTFALSIKSCLLHLKAYLRNQKGQYTISYLWWFSNTLRYAALRCTKADSIAITSMKNNALPDCPKYKTEYAGDTKLYSGVSNTAVVINNTLRKVPL